MNEKPNKIAIKLKPSAERMVKKGHPWIFEESIVKQSINGKTGDIAIIFDEKKNKFLAVGLYDQESVIKIKCFQFHQKAELNQEFFDHKIKESLEIRKPLITNENNSYRLIYGENDLLPSIIIDIYDKNAVIKLYSLIWKNYIDLISNSLKKLINIECIVLRLSRNIQSKSKELQLTDGQVIFGKLQNYKAIFIENNIKYYADLIKGHKTGFFLDQRQNRKKVGLLAKNKKVLDVFSFNGGFTLNCLHNLATEVTSVDINQFALDEIKENITLNKFKNKHNIICGDAFKVLNNLISKNIKYDLVIIDPPSFAKKENEIETAKQQYIRLANMGSTLVSKGGILVLASCSSRITADDFFECNQIGFSKNQSLNNIEIVLLDKTFHDIDHPVKIKEMNYLKCGYYKFI